jgi:hypothetical protein
VTVWLAMPPALRPDGPSWARSGTRRAVNGRHGGTGGEPSGVTIAEAMPSPGSPAGPVLARRGGGERNTNGCGRAAWPSGVTMALAMPLPGRPCGPVCARAGTRRAAGAGCGWIPGGAADAARTTATPAAHIPRAPTRARCAGRLRIAGRISGAGTAAAAAAAAPGWDSRWR